MLILSQQMWAQIWTEIHSNPTWPACTWQLSTTISPHLWAFKPEQPQKRKGNLVNLKIKQNRRSMWKICRIWVEEFTHLDQRSFSSIWNPQLLNTDISMTQNFWWTCLNVVVTGAHAGASDSAGTAWAYLLKCLYQGWITEVHSQQIWHKRSQSNTFFPQIAHFTHFSLACFVAE